MVTYLHERGYDLRTGDISPYAEERPVSRKETGALLVVLVVGFGYVLYVATTKGRD